MANLPVLLTLSIIMLLPTLPSTVSAITPQATSTVAKDQVPCTMCVECEDPCQPHPSPPPPPPVKECPPPPAPPPPPVIECPPPPVIASPPPPVIASPPPPVVASPPPPVVAPAPPPVIPSPPPPVIPSPPPPRLICKNGTCLPSWMPPESQYPQVKPYFPPAPPRPAYLQGTSFPLNGDTNDGGKLMTALRFWNPSSYYVYFTFQSLSSVALLCLPYYFIFR